MRARRLAATLVIGGLATAVLLAQPDPPRVDPAEAIKQLVKRVDPEIPPAAATARVSGTVVAEIIVGTNGRVELVRIIKPVAMLSGPAADAIRQWEFKPFLIGGRAARITTEVSIEFAKPAAPGDGAEKTYYAAAVNCRTLLEAKSPQAQAACQNAVSLADALPAEHWDRRAEARFFTAQSAMAANQFHVAVAMFEESLAFWLEHKPTDVRVAEHYLLIAFAHQSNRNPQGADQNFKRALAAYDERIAAGLVVDAVIAQELETLFTNYAAVRRALKDEAGAKALEARIAKIPGAKPAPPPPPLPRRTLAGVLCVDAGCERLTATDVAEAVKLLPPGTRAWFIDAGSEQQSVRTITVYLERDREFGGLRRGRTISLTKKTSAGPWERLGGPDPEWAQVLATTGDGPLVNRDDMQWPFLVQSPGKTSAIADDDLVAILKAVRDAGAAVRRWPIGSVTATSANQVNVYLKSPERGALPQTVTVTREEKTWRVTKIGT